MTLGIILEKRLQVKLMSFLKGFFLSSYLCSLGWYIIPSIYENEAIVIQMGELCQQCAFDAWGIRYYTTHDHRLCTLPHTDGVHNGIKSF